MNELLKKGFYLGLGTALASKEKVEKYITENVAKGEMAPSEAKKILEDLSGRGKGKQEEWNEQFREEIADALKKLGFVTEQEYDELNARLTALETKFENYLKQEGGNRQ